MVVMRKLVWWGSAVLAIGTACKSNTPSSDKGQSPESRAESHHEFKVGDAAPDVALPLQNGKVVRLSDLKGHAVVLYFYPKDDTPGCRVEAQGFRDLHSEFTAANVLVFGVSTQDETSHRAFIEKEGLPFDLVIDESGRLAAAFGVPMMGPVTQRQTVLVDSVGKLAAKWVDVSPKTHAAEVLVAAKMSATKTE
jgi:thioredoxin-dependent peroxiredoxin